MTRTQYLEMLNSQGSGRRERMVAKGIHDMVLQGADHPSYKSVTIDDEERYLNIISSTVTDQKIIRTRPGEDFTLGSIVYWGGSHWLITERDADSEITVRGKIQICQKEIPWQDPDTLEIVSRWSTVEKPYYSNLSENNYISSSNREFRIQMPFDDYSSKLDLNKRLMLEVINGSPKIYRITSVDQMTTRYDYNGSQIGFLKINVEQDKYDSTKDNVDYMICDYIDPMNSGRPDVDPDEGTTSGLAILYSEDPDLHLFGYGKTFTASIEGVSDCSSTVWTLTMVDESNGNVIQFSDGTMECTGESCTVVCDDDESLLGVTAILTATCKGKTAEIEIEVVNE